ncbi:MAG: hypothetical protein ABI067_05690 [Leifsonia sp.]
MNNSLISAKRELTDARHRLEVATEKAANAALDALESGQSEVAVAAALGVNRLTIRKWSGKK